MRKYGIIFLYTKGNLWSFSPKVPETENETGDSANANTDSLSAFEEISSAIENKSSARAIEK